MTRNETTTCDETTNRMGDYVDGVMQGAALHEMEQHLLTCAACREEERELRALLAAAEALPSEVDLPRDLWPGIAAGIEQAGQARQRRWRWPLGLAAAAALAAGVAVALMAGGRPAGPLDIAPSATPATVAAGTLPSDLRDAEQEYAEATAQLLAALGKRRDELSPEALAAVEENLRAIDVALAQVRAALQQDPGSPQLARLLTSTHRRKVQTLQHVLRLSQPS